jgi:transcription initiation factor TFIIIB Brf1 subunit/transcription initiation factor TFIIB
MYILANKKLEIEACRMFACPNLGMIDQKGKELGLMDDVIKRAKDMAIEYFKKTYHNPQYLSGKNLMPSFLYIASNMEDKNGSGKDRRTQLEVSNAFNLGIPTIRKWNTRIIDTLELEVWF